MKRTVLAILAAVMALTMGGVVLAQTPTPQAESAATPAPWIGVTLSDISERVAARMGITGTTGVAVVSVVKASPAEKAGVQAKDVITAVDGKPLSKAAEVTAEVQAKKIGDPLALAVLRGNASQNLTVTVGEKPASPGKRLPDAQAPSPDRRAPWGGLLDGLKGLAPGEAFGRMLGQQWRFLDQDNKVVTIKSIPGTVVSAAKDSITITPNDPSESGGPFAITSDTQVRLAGKAGVESLKPGDQVVVVTADGKTALSVAAGSIGDWGSKPGGKANPMPHAPARPGRDKSPSPAPAPSSAG